MIVRGREHLERYAFTALALGAAWGLKRHYSLASAEELRWILKPTTALTQLVLGSDFAFQPPGLTSQRLKTNRILAAGCLVEQLRPGRRRLLTCHSTGNDRRTQ